MELRVLRYFQIVVETGSFTAAAGQLFLSQPSLSVAMAKLESELGVQLLVRTARGVEPTSAGRFLLDTSARILGEVDEIGPALRRFASGSAGTLTMAVVPALLWHRVPQLLRAHAVEAPDLEVRLVDPPPWIAIDMLEQRAVDLAVIMVAEPERFAERHRAVFDILDWGDIPLVAALPPEESAAPSPLPLGDFAGSTLLVPSRTAAVPSLPEQVEEALRRHGIEPRSVRTVDTIQTILPLIEAGHGWAILPDADGESLRRFEVVVRPLDPPPTPLRALVLTRRGSSSDPALTRLLARISETETADRV